MVFQQALSAPVIAVASTSAICAWISLIPESQKWDNAIAYVGETTALAAKMLGLRNVYFPENPGLEGWVNSIIEALQVYNQLQEARESNIVSKLAGLGLIAEEDILSMYILSDTTIATVGVHNPFLLTVADQRRVPELILQKILLNYRYLLS